VIGQTRTLDLHRDEAGVVSVRVRRGTTQALDDARANVEAVIQLFRGRPGPLLVDLRQAQPLPAEARHHYAERLAETCTAQALLVEDSPHGRTIGEIYMEITRPIVPTDVFTDELAALSWLRQRAP
jgi:hypothetical protein